MRRTATLSPASDGILRRRTSDLIGIAITLGVLSAYLAFLEGVKPVLAAWAAIAAIHFLFFSRRRAPAFARGPADLSPVTDRDPAFRPRDFLASAESLFERLESAWAAGRLVEVRRFVSDGLYEQLSVQRELQGSAAGNGKPPRIVAKDFVRAASDGRFDRISVALRAEGFAETWTFLRAAGATGTGAAEGRCPNCGAALEIADAAVCPACKSWISSAKFGWIACAIADSDFWFEPSDREIPGLSALRGADPDFRVSFLRDRAAVAFWRWQAAVAQGRPELMRGISLDSVCDELAQAAPERVREPMLISAEVRKCENDGERDWITAGVLWTGAGLSERRRQLITFVRKAGVRTDLRTGLCSTRCPRCGAAPSRRDAASCEYCGQAFNDGTTHWTVERIADQGSNST